MTGIVIIAGTWCVVEDRRIVRAVKASNDHASMVWAAGHGRVDRPRLERPILRVLPVHYAGEGSGSSSATLPVSAPHTVPTDSSAPGSTANVTLYAAATPSPRRASPTC